MKSCVSEVQSEALWSLIYLENELIRACTYLRVLGKLPEDQMMVTSAAWAGYIFTFLRLDDTECCSVLCADVAASVRALAIEVNEGDWLSGCRQAQSDLNQPG